ncbi:MAG: hypothetical protein ACSLFK_06480 [Gemmatimonadaceae bacterium]
MRRGRQGERARNRKALAINESGCVNPALVQGQSVFLPEEISLYTRKGDAASSN